jgi:hypothetical protein
MQSQSGKDQLPVDESAIAAAMERLLPTRTCARSSAHGAAYRPRCFPEAAPHRRPGPSMRRSPDSLDARWRDGGTSVDTSLVDHRAHRRKSAVRYR